MFLRSGRRKRTRGNFILLILDALFIHDFVLFICIGEILCIILLKLLIIKTISYVDLDLILEQKMLKVFLMANQVVPVLRMDHCPRDQEC